MTAVDPQLGRAQVLSYRNHITSLDGWRGIAILLVFLHHRLPRQAWNPLSIIASAGWIGVDLFFVLSGFLITGILVDTLGRPRYFSTFFARRSLRLLPVYVLVIGLCIAFHGPLHMPLTWIDLPFFAYGANIIDALNVSPPTGPNIHFNFLWSLAVEEQFYLLWAPIIFFLRDKKHVLIACITGIVLATVLRCAFAPHVSNPRIIYELLPMRMDALLCGGLLAVTLRLGIAQAWFTTRRLHLVALAGVLLFCTAVLLSHSFWGNRIPMQLIGYTGNDLLFTALLTLALLPGTWANTIGNLSWLRFVGRYSYGLYMFHFILLYPYDRAFDWLCSFLLPRALAPLFATILLFAATLLMAVISYHCFEEPFLRLKKYFPYAVKGSRTIPVQQDVPALPVTETAAS